MPKADDEDAIRFKVSYGLREYHRIVRDHMAHTDPQHSGNPLAKLLLALFIPVIFALKKRKVGDCEFVIDGEGVLRRAKDGEGRLPWKSVTAVHRYSAAYLVEKKNGAMPIPYRCLDAAQRARMEALIDRWEARRTAEDS